jgi:hypothetical protein
VSYTILYDSVGIRLPKSNLYLTLCKSGCNNVYDAHGNGNKRSRSWSFWSPLGHKPYPLQTLVDNLNSWRDNTIETNKRNLVEYDNWSTYSDASFGYYASIAKCGKTCSTTSFKQVYNHYIHKNYIDFEEFTKVYAVYVDLPYYCISKELEGSVKPERVFVKTEDELLQTIEEFSCKYVGIQFYVSVIISDDTTSKEIYRRVAPNLLPPPKIVRKKELKQVESFYTVMFMGSYFKKRTSRSIVYSYFHPQFKFETEKQAAAKLSKVGRGDDRFSIKLINQTVML